MSAVRRVYLIGAGVIAGFHAKAVNHLPDAANVTLAVTDPNPTALAKFIEAHPRARPFPDVDAMLAEPAEDGDVVIVATPPVFHAALSIKAMRGGRHVLCEKPLAMNRAEAQQMLDAARQNNRLFACCSNRFLGQPTAIAAREKIASGALGDIYHATFVHRIQRNRTGIEYQPASKWMLDRSRNGGGPMSNWSPYDFTVLNELLRPTRVDVLSAWTTQVRTQIDPTDIVNDVETHLGATLRYHLPDGQTPQVTYERSACTHGSQRFVVEIDGTCGALAWDWLKRDGREGAMEFSHDVAGKPQIERVEKADETLGPHDKPLVYLAQRIAGEDSPAVVNEQAAFNYACIGAIYETATTGKPQTVELQ